jgi:hypothetical protein
MRRYRRGARFVMPCNHCRPLDRNQRARILHLAESLERRTKVVGGRNGVLGYVGVAVLKALLFQFNRGIDGMCCPSYTVLQAATGLCRQSIARALQRLEAAGILRITRRLIRETIDGVMICRQGSNLYAIGEPSERAELLPVRSPAPRSFPRPAFAALAKMLGWPSLRDRGKPTPGFQLKETIGQEMACQ